MKTFPVVCINSLRQPAIFSIRLVFAAGGSVPVLFIFFILKREFGSLSNIAYTCGQIEAVELTWMKRDQKIRDGVSKETVCYVGGKVKH